jgi:4,5-DOPA dioxygenase extradiol
VSPAETVFPFDTFLADAAPRSREHQAWMSDDGPLPGIFLGHGAPPLLDDPLWMGQLFDWALVLPKPRGILIVSAHWESAPLALSGTQAATPLVYDFGGFDRRFFEMTYPTPDASGLAQQVAAMMPDSAPLHEHRKRGLDHGAWVPLKVMYPNADVPAVQLSLPTDDPWALVDIGRRLKTLREQGVLVIGSGFMTHGLPYLTRADFEGVTAPQGWSVEFDEWAREALAHGDIDTLAAYLDKAPGMPFAHPTVEHFLPLFVTMGMAARTDTPVRTVIEGFAFGLSKRSFEVV